MSATALLDRLETASILVDRGPDGVGLADAFREDVAAYEDRWRESSVDEAVADLRELTDWPDADGTLAALGENRTRTLGFVAALAAVDLDLTAAEALQTAVTLDVLDDPPAQTAGAPRGFVPVRGPHLANVLSVFRRAVVYVWREDCEPCEVMRDELEGAIPSDSVPVGRFAVYGPADGRLLADEYDVEGAPTTLFCLDGAVDARLLGAHYGSIVAAELEASYGIEPDG